jgi:hypothetical protein
MNGQSRKNESKLGRLEEAWNQREEMELGEWVSEVSSAFFNTSLELGPAAEFLGAQPAELHAALTLATLSDENLILVSSVNPPITAWHFLADAPEDGVSEVLEAISSRPKGMAAGLAASEAVSRLLGPSKSDLVASLGSNGFSHIADKATQHNALNDKHRKALRGWGRQLRMGKSLTPKQVAYAYGLIEALADQGIISVNSPDGDLEIMEAALKALGRL